MPRTHVWANPAKTSGWTGYWGQPGVKTNGIVMPSMNTDDVGDHPINVGAIFRGYASGVSPIWQGMYYRGVETQGYYTWSESGGVFDFFIRGGAGTMYFGREEAQGRTVIDENDGYQWPGTLAGSFEYCGVGSSPGISASLNADKRGITVRLTDPSDDGGCSLSEFRTQYAMNGSGSYGHDRVNVGYTINFDSLIQGNTYRFRSSVANGVGRSQWNYTGWIEVPRSGGKRHDGSAFVQIQNGKRYTGTAWVDLVTKKRYTGSAWTDITN